MDAGDDVRTGEREEIIVAALVVAATAALAVGMPCRWRPQPVIPFDKALAAIVGFLQLVALDHRAHRAVDDEDAARQRSLLVDPEPAGRKLDFVVQEMNREFNTIGSKANDAGIAQTIVEAKTELEKIREQVQNVE